MFSAIARNRVRSAQLAEDATQEALMLVLKNADKFKNDSKVKTWAFTIINNACIDLLRKEKVRTEFNVSDDPLEYEEDDSSNFADRKTTQIAVWEAIEKLPEDQRLAIKAVAIDGYSVDEAAEMLGVPVGTIKSRCDRARKAMAEKLREFDPKYGTK
jgi:RNA polymerase sigma-70 factor (ECF subfamily)